MNRWFSDDNIHRICIPRGRLMLLFLLLFVLECAIFLLWQGIFIILSVFLSAGLLYMIRVSCRIWRRYYSLFWYITILALLTGGAFGVRILIL